MKRKGKIVDDPAKKSRPARLDVFQAVNVDAVCILLRGDLPALGVFPWIAHSAPTENPASRSASTVS